jgi:hypothetical protein
MLLKTVLTLGLSLAIFSTTASFSTRKCAIQRVVHSETSLLHAATLRDSPPASSANLGGVHGLKHLQEITECQCYSKCPLLVNSPQIQSRLAKVTTPRAYPLFLAEKAAKYLFDDIWNPPRRLKEDAKLSQQFKHDTSEKEKVVILGAGWGSAAFLKGIDTERYDVTIISPRNFFLFTPMLSGSAVGTVDIRSITQPIREVNIAIINDTCLVDTEVLNLIHCSCLIHSSTQMRNI